ncbi:hypothetical protein ABFB09_08655, partial [Dehalogenimonas sp. THU2]|uniref:hypothetical protein n=1 Tax=Dehalogenimonas sp. THU2 TaxID=3151121 RepID=UPI0032184412
TSLLFCGFDEENAGRGAGGTPYHGFTTLMIRETTNHEFTPLDGTLPPDDITNRLMRLSHEIQTPIPKIQNINIPAILQQS